MSTTLTTRRIGVTSDYTAAVIRDGEQIATTFVARMTARTHRYGVTLADGRTLDETFPSVKRAAAAAAVAVDASVDTPTTDEMGRCSEHGSAMCTHATLDPTHIDRAAEARQTAAAFREVGDPGNCAPFFDKVARVHDALAAK